MLGAYRTLLPFVRKYRWYYVFGVLTLVVTSGGQLFIPQLIRRAIDTMTVTGFSLATVGRYMLLLVGLAAVIAVARFGWRYFLHGASRRIEAELREQLFGNLLNLSSSYYRETTTGDLMARATNDLRNVRMAAGMGLGKIGGVIHPYPTQSEAIKRAAGLYNQTRLTPTIAKLMKKWLAWQRR